MSTCRRVQFSQMAGSCTQVLMLAQGALTEPFPTILLLCHAYIFVSPDS